MNCPPQLVLLAPSFEGNPRGLRFSRLRFGPLVPIARSSFNFELSIARSERGRKVNLISLTPFSSAPSTLSQKLYFAQTFSNLCLAHSFAKHRGVGGHLFQIAAGFSQAQSVALELTRSFGVQHSTFDVRRAFRRPSSRWRTDNSNLFIHFRTLFHRNGSRAPTAKTTPLPPFFGKM